MELRHLEAVVAVAETGSTAAASRRLQVAQPALSRTVAALEHELGAALFERTGRGMAVTAAGRALLPRARRALTEAAEGARAAQRAHRGAAGVVTIGMVSSATYSPLADAVSAFAATRSDTDLTVREMPTRQVSQALLEGRIEVGVGLGPVRGREAGAVRSVRLQQDELAVAVGRAHPLAGTGSIEPARLSAFTLITTDSEGEPDLAAALRPVVGSAHVQTALDSWMVVRLAALGVGAGLVPRQMASTMAAAGSANIELVTVVPPVRLPPLVLSVRQGVPAVAVRALLQATPVLRQLTEPLLTEPKNRD